MSHDANESCKTDAAVCKHDGHAHGAGCGHDAVQHGDHVDYLHDGHKHAAHGDHYDEHGES